MLYGSLDGKGIWGRMDMCMCMCMTESLCCSSEIIMTLLIGYHSGGKESAFEPGELDSTPGLGRSTGEGNGYPLQYSSLKNSIDKEAWQATVHGATKSLT